MNNVNFSDSWFSHSDWVFWTKSTNSLKISDSKEWFVQELSSLLLSWTCQGELRWTTRFFWIIYFRLLQTVSDYFSLYTSDYIQSLFKFKTFIYYAQVNFMVHFWNVFEVWKLQSLFFVMAWKRTFILFKKDSTEESNTSWNNIPISKCWIEFHFLSELSL